MPRSNENFETEQCWTKGFMIRRVSIHTMKPEYSRDKYPEKIKSK
jgi:hypothetical protein